MVSLFGVNPDIRNNPFFLTLHREGLRPGQQIKGEILDIKDGKALIQYRDSSFWALLTGEFPSKGEVQLRILGERNGQLLLQYENPLEEKGLSDERITDLLHQQGIPSTPKARELVQLLFSYQLPMKKETLHSLQSYLKDLDLKEPHVRDSLAFLVKEGLPLKKEGLLSLTTFFQKDLNDLLKTLQNSLKRRGEIDVKNKGQEHRESLIQREERETDIDKGIRDKSPLSSRDSSRPPKEKVQGRIDPREYQRETQRELPKTQIQENRDKSPLSSRDSSTPPEEKVQGRIDPREYQRETQRELPKSQIQENRDKSPLSSRDSSRPPEEKVQERIDPREHQREMQRELPKSQIQENRDKSPLSSRDSSTPPEEKVQGRIDPREYQREMQRELPKTHIQENRDKSTLSSRDSSTPPKEKVQERIDPREHQREMQRELPKTHIQENRGKSPHFSRDSSTLSQEPVKEGKIPMVKGEILKLLKETLNSLPLRPDEEEITPQRIEKLIEEIGLHHERQLHHPSKISSVSLKSLLLRTVQLEEVEEIEGVKNLLTYITGKQIYNLGSDQIYLEIPIYYEKEWNHLKVFLEKKTDNGKGEDTEDLFSIGLFISTTRLGEIGVRILLHQKELSLDFYTSLQETERIIRARKGELETFLTEKGLLLRRLSLQRLRAKEREEHFTLPKIEKDPKYYGHLDIKV